MYLNREIGICKDIHTSVISKDDMVITKLGDMKLIITKLIHCFDKSTLNTYICSDSGMLSDFSSQIFIACVYITFWYIYICIFVM